MFHETASTPRPRPPNNSRNRTASGRRFHRPSLSASASFPSSASSSFSTSISSSGNLGSESGDLTDPRKLRSIPSSIVHQYSSPPPPPYLSISGLPLSIEDPDETSRVPGGLVGISVDSEGSQKESETTEQWVKARSREELDRLLLEADKVIRERERELELAASIGKSLLENNIALRKRHESLLASLPETMPTSHRRPVRPSAVTASSWVTDDSDAQLDQPAPDSRPELHTPARSRVHSFGLYSHSFQESLEPDEELFQSYDRPPSRAPEFLSSSSSAKTNVLDAASHMASTTTESSPTSATFSGTITRHRRRQSSLSASPQALAFLREQNHELAVQLEALQEETEDADQTGKKKLRKLEKEIGSLRAALEGTEAIVDTLREKNQTLEQEVGKRSSRGDNFANSSRDGGWAERRRARLEQEIEENNVNSDRNSSALESRKLSTNEPSSASSSPSSDRASGFKPKNAPAEDGSPIETSSLSPSISPRARSLSLLGPELSAKSSPRKIHPQTADSETEKALISQLLKKIEELEHANTDIRKKRDEMDAKLDKAKKEGDELKGVYEILESEVEKAGLEVIDLDEQTDKAEDDSRSGRRPTRSSSRKGSPSLITSENKARLIPTTPGRSPTTSSLEIKFFSSSPPITDRLSDSNALSPSPSVLLSSPRSILHDESPSGLLFHAAPASVGPTSPSSRFGTGNRLTIERRRRTRAASPFISPTISTLTSPTRLPRGAHDSSIGLSPEGSSRMLHMGSPLKLRISYTTEMTDCHQQVRRMTLENEFGEIEEKSRTTDSESSLFDPEPKSGQPSWRKPLETANVSGTSPSSLPSPSSMTSNSRTRLSGRHYRRARLEGVPHTPSPSSIFSISTIRDEFGTVDPTMEGWEDEPSGVSDGSSSFSLSPSHSNALMVRSQPEELVIDRESGVGHSLEDQYLDTSTPIFPLGSLTRLSTFSNSETFELLDRAVSERVVRWSDESLDPTSRTGTSPHGIVPAADHDPMSIATALWSFLPTLIPLNVSDPFETTFYPEPVEPDEEDLITERRSFREERMNEARRNGLDPYSREVLRAPTKRELAARRVALDRTISVQDKKSSGGDGNGNRDDETNINRVRYRSWSSRVISYETMDRISARWIETLMDLWFFCQIVVIAVVFINEMVRNGRKTLRAIDRHHPTHKQR
ncbi:HAP1, N-terminal [Phaffia rhodozyma]|uniref:HAP1, N-terminal n=1 Tax=Phaffia rhodozyma TaxID=264483 RepID=A0A0F7SIN9_PHARH|nr:HAP1, N-terminal [Phaffia rhodozyma]